MITITDIELSDLEQFAALGEELFGSKTNMDQLTSVFDRIKANSSYIFIGAKDDQQRLLGSAMGIICMDTVGQCQPFMVIENVVVSKNSQRQGVGKKLIAYLEERAREQNCYFVMLMSHAKRKDAHLFYESIGYPKDIAQGFKKYL